MRQERGEAIRQEGKEEHEHLAQEEEEEEKEDPQGCTRDKNHQTKKFFERKQVKLFVCLPLNYFIGYLFPTFYKSSNPIPCRQVPRLEREEEEEEEGKFIIAPIFVLTGDEDREEEEKGHSDESISGGGERGCFILRVRWWWALSWCYGSSEG